MLTGLTVLCFPVSVLTGLTVLCFPVSVLTGSLYSLSLRSLFLLALCLLYSPLTVLTDHRLKGDVIGRELRAIALAYLDNFNVGPGISCYAPMINIIRCLLHHCQLPPNCLCSCAPGKQRCAPVVPCDVHLCIDFCIELSILSICAHTENHCMSCEYPGGSSDSFVLWQGSDVGQKQ